MSVLDYSHLGSALSLRSFGRLGASLSVHGEVRLGNELTVNSDVAIGGTTRIYDRLRFTSANTYIREDTAGAGDLEFYVTSNKALTMSSLGGRMHGTWYADTTLTTSDRTMKSNIRPLLDTMHENQKASRETAAAVEDEAVDGGGGAAAGAAANGLAQPSPQSTMDWVLRQLRPVSYNFKSGAESKHMRFGFIADEMEKILPQVVRELPTEEKNATHSGGKQEEIPKKKGIIYGDLIAVLTASVKDLGGQLSALTDRVKTAELELDHLDEQEPMGDFL